MVHPFRYKIVCRQTMRDEVSAPRVGRFLFLLLTIVACYLASFSDIRLAIAGATIQLPQTGQTVCYNAAGNKIDCTGTGQDGDVQVGAAWPNPRFTRGTGIEADCVTDNLTGLVWSRNANLTNDSRNWYSAIDYANTLTLCDRSDWRLPNITELASLLNASAPDNAAWLRSQGFTSVMSGLDDYYWASSTNAYWTTSAATQHMSVGFIGFWEKSQKAFRLWPVRGSSTVLAKTGQTTAYTTGDDGDVQAGVAWPNPRFTQLTGAETDCVTDNLTGLMWPRDANLRGTKATWSEGLDFANKLSLCGHSDWRLPNRTEILSLYDQSQGYPGTMLPAGHPFVNVQATGGRYWSSTTFAPEPGTAWVAYIWTPFVSHDSKTVKDYQYVWPVRSGGRQTLPLSSGWNLISLPLQPRNISITSVLLGIKGFFQVVWAYHDGTWKVYDPSDAAGSTLTTMEAGRGYWMKMTAANKTLSVSGSTPSSSITLSDGWNLVGYSGSSCASASSALSSIAGALDVCWGYPDGVWQEYSTGDSTHQLCPGLGYWIKVNGAPTWSGW